MTELVQCPRCGERVPDSALNGLCPACMLRMGATPTDAGTSARATAPPPPSMIAAHFPHLEIVECLGRGGMGVVYKARQPKLNRWVALKILAPEKESDPRFAERFEREARALAGLDHPHIVTVHDFGEADGLFFLLMEYVDGSSLRQLLRAGRILPETAITIIPRICEALEFAHERGVVHRDIKPENVLLRKDGRVKIADFGIAKIMRRQEDPGHWTADHQVVGTPHYMAPEQAEDPQRVDHRADIFSLGVLFYEMLTGELPLGKFQPPSARTPNPIDVRLDDIILRALEKEPDRRYQDVRQVQTALEALTAADEARDANPPVQPHLETSRLASSSGVELRPARVGSRTVRLHSGWLWGLVAVSALALLVSLSIPHLFLAEKAADAQGARSNSVIAQAPLPAPAIDAPAPALALAAAAAPPVVIRTIPESGSSGIDPSLSQLTVTFSRLMQDGTWSWVAWSDASSPETTGSPGFLADGRTCVLPVRLKPGKVYALWLNSDTHQNFRDRGGRPAVPYLLIFETAQ